MTTFGIIWMIIVIFAFFMKDIKYMIAVTLIGMLFQCNNVIIFNNGISCGSQLITSAIFIIRTMKYRKKTTSNQKNKYFLIILILYIIFNMINIYNNDFSNYLPNLIQLLIYTLVFYRMIFISSFVDKNFIDKCIKALSIIILIVGLLQMTVVMFNIPRNNILQTLIYNDVTNTNIYYTKSHFRFYSTFMEPSFVSGLLVGLFFYFFSKNTKKKIDIVLMILLFLSLMLTFSSTAYGSFFIIAVLYLLAKIKKKSTWLYVILGIIGVVGLSLTTDILDKVIFDKSSTASARVRTQWNERAYNSFLESPIIGKGYKSLRASSIILDLMGELGSIGLVIYLKSIWEVIKNLFKKTNSFISTSTCNIVCAVFISQIIACPDLDLCSFWLAMYLFALTNNYKKIKEIENK